MEALEALSLIHIYVLAVPIPELRPMFGFEQHNPHHDRDVWLHTAAVVEHIPPEPVLRWAALLHDVGKPPCFSLGPDGVGHFSGHAAKSLSLIHIFSRRTITAASRSTSGSRSRWNCTARSRSKTAARSI